MVDLWSNILVGLVVVVRFWMLVFLCMFGKD